MLAPYVLNFLLPFLLCPLFLILSLTCSHPLLSNIAAARSERSTGTEAVARAWGSGGRVRRQPGAAKGRRRQHAWG
uniref:Secreted protein n=1 Tax=Oryza sativa subsp. japonica TaxID=39947 RepID=Q6Z5S5_ORYSJ|nr:hypothetical protein [Oryza sativa Japonica Group]